MSKEWSGLFEHAIVRALENDSADVFLSDTDERNPLRIFRHPIPKTIRILAENLGIVENDDDFASLLLLLDFFKIFEIGSPNTFSCMGVLRERVGACGLFSQLFAAITTACGIPSRIIGLYNFPTPEGSFDGHIVVECLIQGRWVLVDPSYSAIFRRKDMAPGELLSLKDFMNKLLSENLIEVVVGNTERVRLQGDGALRYLSPEFYRECSPCGPIDANHPMVFSLDVVGETEISESNFPKYGQQLHFIGTAFLNLRRLIRISGLSPGQRYCFEVQVTGAGDELRIGRAVYARAIPDGTITEIEGRNFAAPAGMSSQWKIIFISSTDRASILLTHDYVTRAWMNVSAYRLRRME